MAAHRLPVHRHPGDRRQLLRQVPHGPQGASHAARAGPTGSRYAGAPRRTHRRVLPREVFTERRLPPSAVCGPEDGVAAAGRAFDPAGIPRSCLDIVAKGAYAGSTTRVIVPPVLRVPGHPSQGLRDYARGHCQVKPFGRRRRSESGERAAHRRPDPAFTSASDGQNWLGVGRFRSVKT